jgi:3',5'-nucleoside bisphosphate phosphatase
MNLSTSGLSLAADAAIDLQRHTIYSDGRWIPEQLLDHLVQEEFGLVAIADHDRVDTAVALQQLAQDKHLPVLVAVEMTASWRGEMTDLLCTWTAQRPASSNLAFALPNMRFCMGSKHHLTFCVGSL